MYICCIISVQIPYYPPLKLAISNASWLPCLLASENVRPKLHLSKGSLSDGLSEDVVT